MTTYTQVQIDQILTSHAQWLAGDDGQRGAVLRDADLRYADLRYADLRGAVLRDADLRVAVLRDADLRDADLRGADLRGAVLRVAVLRDADLRDADLRVAVLRDADLRGADLRGAVLRDADLSGAVLRDADLRGCHMNWRSHELVGQRLLQAAGTRYERVTLAGGIAISDSSFCWQWWLDHTPVDVREWALSVMRTWVRDGDEAPAVLREVQS